MKKHTKPANKHARTAILTGRQLTATVSGGEGGGVIIVQNALPTPTLENVGFKS